MDTKSYETGDGVAAAGAVGVVAGAAGVGAATATSDGCLVTVNKEEE